MTTIQYGGGPTDEQRKEFFKVKHGSQKPGYTGCCPQIKYNPGRTYGDQTHICATDYPHVCTEIDNDKFARPAIRNEIPTTAGLHNYLKDMVPGYSGYVPRLKFQFGETYTKDSELAIDEHLTNHKQNLATNKELHETLVSFPRLQALNFDPEVKDHLNTYRDPQCLPPVLYETRRTLLEPAMYGFSGFIPRIYTTEAGPGERFYQMNVNGIKMFNHENKTHFCILPLPVCVPQSPSSRLPVELPPLARRVYKKDGMIPRYTGHVPYYDAEFGMTYGETTRHLEECTHDKEYYGEFMATKPKLQPSLIVY